VLGVYRLEVAVRQGRELVTGERLRLRCHDASSSGCQTSASVRRLRLARWVLGVPVARYLRARRDPHVFPLLHVREEAIERRCPARAADDPAMKADVHHAAALPVELLERVDEILVELARGDESVRDQELEVVRVERI